MSLSLLAPPIATLLTKPASTEKCSICFPSGEKIFNKHINVNSYAKYISIQFDILQTMINRGNTKPDIVNYLNTALIPLVNKDKIDAYKIV